MRPGSAKPHRGNPDIGAKGRQYAGEVHDLHVKKLEAAQRRIEAEVAAPGYKGGRVTIQALLEAAGLSPTYLEKDKPKRLKPSIKNWLRGVNGEILASGTSPSAPVSRAAQAASDMQRILSKYAALDFELKHREAELRALRLEDQNERYREMLNGADPPSRINY